ncbi:MAG: hypothetical protein IJR94_06660 [Synergistaceae bacterium]|nr:hypothetical protein [Synergistaceae bacterium]
MREKTPAEKIFDAGFAIGFIKGFKEGFKEGYKEGRTLAVKSFMLSGLLNDEQIAAALHKPLENIKAIRKELEAATV